LTRAGVLRICILTPGQIGSNPRVVKEAQSLSQAGFNVTVIATKVLDVVEMRDQSLMEGVPWRIHRLEFSETWQRAPHRAFQKLCRSLHAMTALNYFANFSLSPFTSSLYRRAHQTPADLYIAHYPGALPAAVGAALRNGGKYAYDAEDYHLGDWPRNARYDRDRKLVRSIEGRFLQGCAYITAASPGIAAA
jgi:hypothetical protein